MTIFAAQPSTRRSALKRFAAAAALLLLPGLASAQPAPAPAAAPPPFKGIAHVAIQVRDLAAAVSFYQKLGFEQAFALSKDGAVYESFIKINDQQFLELYPANPQAAPPKNLIGFLHLCFEGEDLNAIHDDYVARGLTPIPVRKAGAGNLLFTLAGPAQPAFAQNIEYTQYQPGSLHSNNRGQHLGPTRLGDRLVTVTLAMVDPAAARDFYLSRLGFTPVPRTPGLLLLPGTSGQSVEIAGAELGNKARLTFHSTGLARARRQLRQAGVAFTPTPHGKGLTVLDPDGNILSFSESTP